MAENQKKIWFPAKSYGFGWGLPVTWQGWLVLVSYILLITAGSVAFELSCLHPAVFFLSSIGLTALFLLILWKKGEKLGWRWGATKDGK